MWPRTRLTDLLHVKYPVIQGGMAGGITTPALVAAVSNAGGLGTLGAGYMTPEAIQSSIREIRAHTSFPFAVNLFVPEYPSVSVQELAKANRTLNRFRAELQIPSVEVTQFAESFSEQVAVVLQEKVPVFSFTFGLLPHEIAQDFHDQGTTLIGTATSVREAIALEESGVDAVVGQGAEAGGHRGTFGSSFASSMVGTLALIPQMVNQVHIPVIAAGGIAEGRGIVAALALGAAGVQLGTAFLSCHESGAHDVHKTAVLHSTDVDTAVTCAFSGKPARGLENDFMREMSSKQASILPYPFQNALTRDIRSAAAKQGRAGYMSLWAGQASGLSRSVSAGNLMSLLTKEVEHVIQQLRSTGPIQHENEQTGESGH